MSGLSSHLGHRCIAANGYDVEYLRVPVTDEKAPKTSDFAILAARAWDPPEGAALMYNCQMGRGRTTTGMIIASLIILRRRLSDSKSTPTASALLGWERYILMHVSLKAFVDDMVEAFAVRSFVSCNG